MKKLCFMIFSIMVLGCEMTDDSNKVKQLIAATLEKETEYFCKRDFNSWQQQWSHGDFVSKMYAGEGKFQEFLGWQQINQFTMDHIKQYPEAIPIPESDHDYQYSLFKDTAWVFYTKKGENGPVRETRFMVNEGGRWKIARMQTIF